MLGEHDIHAELGSGLDSEPEFLRAAASAAIDAHERYPVLHEGNWPLQGVYAVSALAPNDGLRVAFEHSNGVLAANALAPGRHAVVLNDSTDARMRDMAQSDHGAAEAGQFVPAHRTSYGLVMHEMGHATARAEYGPYSDDVIGQAVLSSGFESFDDIERVSHYAAVSPHEFFAETFAQRNMPEGWACFDAATQARLERFAVIVNAGRRIL
ncbi:MAG: hypothetical protein LC798_11830 [Chloroflexi bacterium]|nr:hypothetical protein [Chloroflexota bacterium]